MGIYGMLLDHAYEINEDLADGSRSIVTAYLEEFGDSKANRRSARTICLDKASDVRKEGLVELSRQQKATYSSILSLFDVKYRLLGRATDYRIKIPSASLA